MNRPEFSRPLRRDELARASGARRIDASDEERAALAERFGLVSIAALSADMTVEPAAGGARVSGRVTASVTQPCVVTGAPVPADIDETFNVRFVDQSHFSRAAEADEEVEIATDDLDVLPIEGGTIDLGELVAQTLALALPPYPRAPDADTVKRAAGIVDEDDARAQSGPFDALAKLRRND